MGNYWTCLAWSQGMMICTVGIGAAMGQIASPTAAVLAGLLILHTLLLIAFRGYIESLKPR